MVPTGDKSSAVQVVLLPVFTPRKNENMSKENHGETENDAFPHQKLA